MSIVPISNFKDDPLDTLSDFSEDPPDDHLAVYKGKFSAERLMMMLDKERLEALEEEFNEHPDGIELHNFIWLMKCAIIVEPEERSDLILGLYYLFQDIDINGDEHMEWSEFTQYIIDAVMSGQGKEKTEDKDVQPSEIMELALTHKSRRYCLSKVVDRNFHEAFMRHVAFHPSLDLISVVEMGSDSVKFFNTSSEIKLVLTPKYRTAGFALSMAYSDKEHLLVVACSDKRFYLFEKDVNAFRPGVSFQTNFVSLALWHFEMHSVWISACDDFNVRMWNMRTGEEIFTFKGHDQIIMDAVEIKNPNSIATASMDGNIIIWEVAEHKTLGMLSGKHSRGVRSIDYCSDYGGNIVSVGYERDIHLWSPEVTLSKCYAGKLEGHNCPVVTCKYFKGRPTCVSADEKANVRVWDIRYKSCLQIIPHDRGNIEVSRLVTLSKLDKFIVAGRRLVWYELVKDLGNKGFRDVQPVFVEFNTYFFQIVVMTKCDLRVYDCMSGRLKKIFTEIQDPRTESELSAMIMDFRNRIFFIGDNSGSIRAYNCANGTLLKKINSDVKENIFDELEEDEEIEDKKKEDMNSEISALLYCNEEKMLIVSSWDSTIMVYDLQDIEEVILLRIMKGGHQGSDITCIAYSPYMSMIASGSSNGIISVWDFELGKLQGASFGHKREITTLAFLDPYPVLITFSLDNTICLWHFKAFGGKTRLKCLIRVKNLSWSGSSDVLSPVSVCFNILATSKPIPRVARKKYTRQRKQRIKEKKIFFKTSEKNVESDNESVFEWVEDQVLDAAEDFGDCSVRERCYLYIGDTLGYLKVWNFDSFLQKNKISPLGVREKDKASYNPRRKDIKNAESDIKYWRKEADAEEMPPVLSAEVEILVREWKAHDEAVGCIRPVEEPKAVLTCSGDKFIKLWSREGELWGRINVASAEPPKNWSFPYDWEGKKQSDINKVMKVLSLIEENIDINTKALTAPPKTAAKKKIREKHENHLKRTPEPKPQTKQSLPLYNFDESEDEEESQPKPLSVFKKNYASVADLQKQLDDMDEIRNAEYDETHFDLLKKPSKSRAGPAGELRKVELTKLSQQRLPKLSSVKQKTKPDDLLMSQSALKLNSSVAIRGKVVKRPVGMGKTGMLSMLAGKTVEKFRPKKEELFDVRFRPGESIRVMNRAISSHNVLQGSVLSPYTEDLKTLKKKNDIIRGLVHNRMANVSEIASKKRL